MPIRVEKLSYSYQAGTPMEHKALEDVSLEITDGSYTAVIGHTGSGKSTLMDETEKIMNAQRSRGVNFSEGTLMQRIKAVIPLLIPLFVSSFNRAEELATAMEARGYRGGEGRTKYRVQVWTKIDTIAVILFAIVTILLFVLRKF